MISLIHMQMIFLRNSTNSKTKFEDELLINVYPGLKKKFPHSLRRLSYPIDSGTFVSRFKQKFISKHFAMGHYASATVEVYRMILLTDYTGTQLMQLIKPAMLMQSQRQYNTEVDCTRTGSLFFEKIGLLKLTKGDEIAFLCNKETKNFTVWITTQDKFSMHFTIESQLLIDCIQFAFGDDETPIFKTTYKA